MLVATRDPLQHPGHDRGLGASSFHHHEHGLRGPRFGRAIAAVQIVGTLLGIPVGLASVYSMYRANFSVETTCQALRTNIISMIDKKIDPSARRMLVRREIETFEQSCGAVDPDARAAFKALLAAEKTPAPAPAAVTTEPQTEAPANAVVQKVESPPAPVAKQPPAAHAAAPPRDAAAADARWLEAVRGALVTKPAVNTAARPVAVANPARRASDEIKPINRAQAAAAPVISGPAAPATPSMPMNIAPMTVTPTANAAPALPPATAVAVVPAQPPDADHPVPPASIPESVAGTGATKNRSWMSQIPLVGSVF